MPIATDASSSLSIVDCLRSAARQNAAGLAYAFVKNGGEIVDSISYEQLDAQARAIAAHLHDECDPGDRVLLVHPPGLEFFCAFFACAYAGLVAVPLPVRGRQRTVDRIARVAGDCEPRLALTTADALPRIEKTLRIDGRFRDLTLSASDQVSTASATNWTAPDDDPHRPVLLQYTSGSTAAPRGVVVTHANLLAQFADVDVGFDHRPGSVMVSWLPVHHDMGLIYCGLQPVARTFPCYLMSPSEFVQRPVTWLQAISNLGASHSGAPNFAYDLCTRKVEDENLRALDLSSWRVAVDGAEPVRADVLDRFLERFGSRGFRAEAQCPSYGLAECTLKVSTTPAGRPPTVVGVNADAFERGGVILDEGSGPGPPKRLVSSGVAGPALEVVIVDVETLERCSAGTIGEIWVKGPLVARGYWGDPARSQDVFGAVTRDGDGPFLRTGDLGFELDGEIFVTGRAKDLVVIRGRNHCPQDIEATVQAASRLLEPHRGVAFSIDTAEGEALVVVQELTWGARRVAGPPLWPPILAALAEQHGVVPQAVVLVRWGRLPTTTSGKLQRRAARAAFLEGTLEEVDRWDRPLPDPRREAVPERSAPPARHSGAQSWLAAQVAELVACDAAAIDADVPLSSYGFDSVLAGQLSARIEKRFHRAFDPTLFYELPDIVSIAAVLADGTLEPSSTTTGLASDLGRVVADPADGTAIVGLGCRLPGASGPRELWELLRRGGDAVRDVPRQRRSLHAFFQSPEGRGVPGRGAYIDDVESFDAAFFGMSPAEADLLDPQHRLLLEVTWEALESTGRSPLHWRGERVGVFVGLSSNDYLLGMSGRRNGWSPHWTTGNSHSVAANRLSHFFDWHGPSVAVDTACSSSLVAVHQAVESLRRGECSLAVVGGVNVVLDPLTTKAFADAGMLAADGACKTFDSEADGYVRGEGCGIVVLEPLSEALRHGRQVRAVVRGTAVNHDGRSNGITAPNGRAQTDVVTAALARAGVEPRLVSYVEAHGTGTRLGDAVEIKALQKALHPAGSSPRQAPCAVGSVKSNIGHLEAAAGIAGLLKTVLALEHECIPPHLHVRHPNPALLDDATTLRVATTTTAWEGVERRRLAGVSSFGFGGANAHVVVEQAPPHGPPPAGVSDREAFLVTISAQSPSSLRMLAERWRDHAGAASRLGTSMAQLEHASHLGRAHLRHRLAVVADSTAALAGALSAWLSGGRSCVFSGVTPPAAAGSPSPPPEELYRDILAGAGGKNGLVERLRRLAAAYVEGADVRWPALHPRATVPVLDIPSYPFERKRHWFGPADDDHVVESAVGAAEGADSFDAVLHRLRNILGRLLRMEPMAIDPREHFLEMGADSIVLANALRAVERAFAIRLSVGDLFERMSTPEALARHLAERGTAATPDGTAPDPAPPGDLVPAIATLPPWSVVAETADPDGRRRRLQSLTASLTTKTAGSKAWVNRHRRQLADNRASAGFRFSTKELLYPLVASRAAGSRVWDVDGNEYLDLTMGFGVNLFGHAPDFVSAALRDEIARGFALGPQHRLAGDVASLVCELTGAERVAFLNSGTEAVMTALRLARTVTGRTRVALFTGSYHGHFDGVLGMRGGNGSAGAAPIAPGVSPSQVADLLPLEYGAEGSLATIKAEGRDVAAVLVEPVQSRRPALQPREFLHQLRTITRDTGTLLIFDEMITGFRVGPGGAQEHFGVKADLATYGKVVGGGMPVGVVAGDSRVMDAVDGGWWSYGDDSYPAAATTFLAGTFNKHPLTMAAGKAVLERIKADDGSLYERLDDLTGRLTDGVNRCFENEGVPIRADRFGSLFRFSHADNWDVLIYQLLSRGIYIWEGRNCFLSSAHTEPDVAVVVDAVGNSIRDLRADRLLPRAASSRPPTPTPAPRPRPLTRSQEQLCLLARLSPSASAAYNEAVVLRFGVPLAEPALDAAVQGAVDRHEALRTVIDIDRVHQRVLHRFELPVARHGWVDPAAADAVTAAAVSAPFDLRSTPPVKALLFVRDGRVHRLALVAHHTIVDGVSLAVLAEEIGRSYAAGSPWPHCDGTPAAPAVPPKPAPTEDPYWVERLSPLPAPLELPTDRVRPPVRTFRGGAVDHEIDRGLSESVATVAKRFRATEYLVWLSGYLLLLHRVSGQDDVVVGIPVSGRDGEGDDAVVAFRAHMVPVRSRIRRADTIQDYLARLRDEFFQDMDHHGAPVDELFERLGLPVDLSRPPLFSATFNIDATPSLEEAFGVPVSVVPHPVRQTKFELSLNLTRVGGRHQLRLEYATDVLDETTARRLAGQYANMLHALVADPGQAVAAVDLRLPGERVPAAADGGRRHTPGPLDLTVVDWFYDTAGRAPARTAVSTDAGDVSFGELAARVSRIAHHLRDRGITGEDAVGVCLPPGPDLPTALLGAMASGGFYVPLDPEFPAARLQEMQRATDASIVITDRRHAPLWHGQGTEVVTLDDFHDQVGALSSEPPGAVVPPEGLAYTIHTSGSTGAPKGVAVPHRALVNLLSSMAVEPGLDADDVLLAITPVSFDIAGLELLLPLVQGARVVLAPVEARRDGRELARRITRCGATVVQATPATWRLLVDQGWTPPPGLSLLCGGEALEADLASRLVAPGGSLWNMYGPTETTIWSSVRKVDQVDGRVDLGRPIARTTFYVVDPDITLVPSGTAGELLIGGAGVARGYVGQPGLTAERFVPDPFGPEPGQRLYRTGDRVRRRDDGRLEFLGRADDQLKVRGHRVEVREIEAVLVRHPALNQVVVMPTVDDAGHQALQAHLVASGPEQPSAAELREWLEARLPAYMVPGRFSFVEAMPLTPSGKVDRRGLRAVPSAPAAAAAFRPPETELERLVARAWLDVLARDGVGVDDNFFDVGGTSLLMGRVHTAVEAALGRSFPLVEALKHPTVRALARHLAEGSPEDAPGPAGALAEAHDRARRRRERLSVLEDR